MLIKIWVDDATDIAGRAELGEEEPRPFAGWLQLLSILAEAIPGPDGKEPSLTKGATDA